MSTYEVRQMRGVIASSKEVYVTEIHSGVKLMVGVTDAVMDISTARQLARDIRILCTRVENRLAEIKP